MSNVKIFWEMFQSIYSKHLSQVFDLDALQRFVIKICFTVEINSICRAGQGTYKFNSQDTALRFLGLRVAISNSQGPISKVPGVRVPCPRIPVRGSFVSGSRVPGSQLLEPRVSVFQGPGSQVSGSQVPGLSS